MHRHAPISLRTLAAALFTCVFAVPAVPTETARPVFEDGEAQVVPAFEDADYWVREDLWVQTEFDSDGDGKLDRMHVAVTRPRQTETEGLKLPAVYITSPYFAGTGGEGREYFWDTRHELGEAPPERTHVPPVERTGMRPIISKRHIEDWVPRGYAVVHSSSPGTGLSEGCPTIGGENESLAPKAVIDWLCGRAPGYATPGGFEAVLADWCTGKVGMTGTSYNGTLPLAAATTGVDGLEVIIPVAPNTSYYHYYRSNGLVRAPGGFLGEDADYLYDYVHSGNPERRDWCDCEVRDAVIEAGIDRMSGDYNAFWAQRDYLNHMGNMRAAMLMSHGFNDWNVMPEHSYRIYAAARAMGLPAQVYYHQGGHGGPPPFKMMNRWFTRYLHGVENGVEDESRAWIVREGDERDNPTAYADYPNPEAMPVTLGLTPGAPERGSLVRVSEAKPGTETLIDNFSFDGEALARAEWTEHRLLYVSPELKEDLHLSGVPRIAVRLAASKSAANLSVWLVSLPWNGKRNAKITDNIITRGWADPQNRHSLTDSAPLVPGMFYDVVFDLQPDDQVIPEGQQIGLIIFSSDKEHTLWPDPGTKLTVDLNGTALTLPVVGGKDAWERAVPRD